MKIPGVESVYRRTGRAEVTEDPMPHTISDVLVVLEARADPRSQKEVAELAEEMPFPVEMTTPMQMRIAEGIGGTPADIQVKLFHPDLAALQAGYPRSRKRSRRCRAWPPIAPEAPGALPRWTVVPDEEALRRLDVPRRLVAKTLRAALQGIGTRPASTAPSASSASCAFRTTGGSAPRPSSACPWSLEDGRVVELGQVARFEETTTPSLLRRESGQRRLALNVRTTGDLGGTANRVEKALEARNCRRGRS